MSKFGAIVLVPFPFTDLTAAKVRPALVVSRAVSAQGDLIVCFITSQQISGLSHTISLPATRETGLKVASLGRLDKLATLDRRVILGELGHISPALLRKSRRIFHGVFGF